MTNKEFSDQFDVLYNNITSNQAPGLDNYEKSVFLTKAQSELIKAYFNGGIDAIGGGYDGSKERQYDFSSLVSIEELPEIKEDFLTDGSLQKKTHFKSKWFLYPDDYFLSINEILNITFKEQDIPDINNHDKQYNIVPINYSELDRLMLKPFKYPSKNIAYRVFTHWLNNQFAEIICKEANKTGAIVTLLLRYIKEPTPIILEDLDEEFELSIGGKIEAMECTLPEEMHMEILDKAVNLAKMAYAGIGQPAGNQQQNQRE